MTRERQSPRAAGTGRRASRPSTRAILFDGDYPMAPVTLESNRDLSQPLADVRRVARTARDAEAHTGVLASIPELRRGRVAAALVKVAARVTGPEDVMWTYRAPELAFAAAMGQLAYYRALQLGHHVRILTTAPALSAHLDEWLAADSSAGLPIGLVLGMEGADPIMEPDQVDLWWAEGLRVVGLAHYGASRYAHGTGTGVEGGLFPAGRGLLRTMDGVGMILDVSHTADRAVRESLEVFEGPVLASHSNARAIVPGERQLPDDLIAALGRRGAVVGISMDAWMLNHRREYDWSLRAPWIGERASRDGPITLDDVADHIVHVCELTGGTTSVAIGGDTDGQGGRDNAPREIESVADYARIGPILRRRGFTVAEVQNVLWRNWRRFYERALPAT